MKKGVENPVELFAVGDAPREVTAGHSHQLLQQVKTELQITMTLGSKFDSMAFLDRLNNGWAIDG